MKLSSRILSIVFITLGSGLLASACVVGAPEGDGPVGEARQELITCTSDCSGAAGNPLTKTCNTSCTATTTSVTCDGVVTPCVVCAANYGTACGTLQCACHYSVSKEYNCAGQCVATERCLCCGTVQC